MENKKSVLITGMNVIIDCSDANIMAGFYSKLMGWEWTHPRSDEGWAAISSPTGMFFIFQEVEGYQPPVWPWQEGKQAQMLHLDLFVNNLEEGVAHAIECGARIADEQYFKTSRTMIDPAGHPFCLGTYTLEPE
ncbi:VOC family protein [Dysgonomonas macrotermitis]|uniref:Glyoxalase-like domain-containing protein n=1 Tax=Dysgonomonas macrotermitis TaxID=1346286 RepID=A0A1M4SPJ0_9BACT|nr:VOC family protein [Dysgonomonas macrotermitis]SHE34095.1 hypothetical protein SAMN05444362_101117 [Dysgonomonas macrotermitis]